MSITKKGFSKTQVTPILFQGGLNTAVPTLSMELGEALELKNYEVNNIARYTRMLGYERFDGQQSPFEASYSSMAVADASSIGPTTVLTGLATGATCRVVAVDYTSNTLGVVNVVGTFQAGELLNTDLTTVVSIPRLNVADSLDLHKVYELGKQDYYRQQITPVPGSGPVRGVVTYRGVVYAFRDAADALSTKMYKSSASGWVEVPTGVTLSPGGYYRFITENFQGGAGTDVLVGCDGVNKAFVYNDVLDTYTEITTGLEPEVPTCLAALPTNILLLGYANGSLMVSAINEPTNFNTIDGAEEIAVGQEILELQVQPNKAVSIFCRERLQVLYGTSPLDFELTTFSASLSCIPKSAQDLGDTVFMTDTGLRRLTRVDQFGDFQDVDLSIKVRDLVARYRDRVVASFVVREKNQYRVVFDDGTGVSVSFLGPEEVLGISTFDYPDQMSCAYSGRKTDGTELIVAGMDDGYVMQMEQGYNHDGDNIEAACRLTFGFFEGPEQRKRFKKIMIEVDTEELVDLKVRADIDYAGPEAPLPGGYRDVSANAGGGYWDGSRWDNLYWSQQVIWVGELFISGVGRNLSTLIVSDSATEPPHTLSSLLVHWTDRARRQ